MKGLLLIFIVLMPFASSAQSDSTLIVQDTLGVVYIDDDSVFAVYAGSGDLSIKERADWITQKLSTHIVDFDHRIDSVYLHRIDDHIWIYSNGEKIFSITDDEAQELGLSAEELAEIYRSAINEKLKNAAWWDWLKAGILRALGALAATFILLLVYRYINRWNRKLTLFLSQKKGIWFTGLSIKKTTLLTPERQIDLIKWVLNTVKWFLIILFGYLYLPIIFSIFPWTRGIADALFGYILSPVKKTWVAFINYLPNVFAIAVIIVVAYYINRFFKFLAGEVKNGNLEINGFYKDWADTTYKLVNIVVIVFTITVIWPYIPGSGSDAFKGISIFVGVLLSLGSTGAISNIISGTVITYMRPFVIGDRVKIADTSGVILEKSLLVTRIKTPKNVVITVPNSMILSSHIINYSNAANDVGVVLHTNVTIGYDVPWANVHEQLIAAAKEVEDLLQKPEPFVLQKALTDFYVDYELNAYTSHPERMERIYSNLHQKIQDKFNEAGIEILSPHYSAIRDGSHTTIPSSYLDKNYKAPPFNIQSSSDKIS